MNANPHIALRRALAMLLALLLAASLPAVAEDISVALDGAPGLKVVDAGSLFIDDLPELSGDPALEGIDPNLSDDISLNLPDDISLDLEEAGPEGDADNSSKPAPTYDAKNYKLTINEDEDDDEDDDEELTINRQDILRVYSSTANIASWTVSKDKLVEVERLSDSRDTIVVYPIAVGHVDIVIKLVNGKQQALSLSIKDAYELKSLSFAKKSMTLLVGQDIDLKQLCVVEPAYANYSLNSTTSDKDIARTSRDNILTGMKPGKVTVTTVSENGLKARMSVVVKANRTKALYAKPTAKAVGKLAKKWTLWPSTLELKGDGSLVCKLWLLNDSAGKLTAIRNLDLSVSTKDDTGDTLIARNAFKSVKVSCAENKWQAVTLTFPAKAVNCPQAFTDLKAKDLSFRLYGTPRATSTGKVVNPAYQPTAILPGIQPAYKNTTKYRALLVSESEFYHPDAKNPSKRWEHVPRNKNNVTMVEKMLQQVKTPDGGKYTITTRNNTTLIQLKQLIADTYAGADANDVSLFFIASHGVSSDSAEESDSGAISMASLEEKSPDRLRLDMLRDLLLAVPGKVIVILQSCGSGAAVYQKNDGSTRSDMARAAEAFDAKVVNVFRSADPGVMESDYAANTGDLRKVNKFYVLTATAYREDSWSSDEKSFFVYNLVNAVGQSGKMPADTQFAGNNNGTVDLHELYRYISGVGDRYKIKIEGEIYYQHVQVYPSDLRFPLFK